MARDNPKSELWSLFETGVTIPLDEVLQAAGVPVPAGLDIDLGDRQAEISTVLNAYFAEW